MGGEPDQSPHVLVGESRPGIDLVDIDAGAEEQKAPFGLTGGEVVQPLHVCVYDPEGVHSHDLASRNVCGKRVVCNDNIAIMGDRLAREPGPQRPSPGRDHTQGSGSRQ